MSETVLLSYEQIFSASESQLLAKLKFLNPYIEFKYKTNWQLPFINVSIWIGNKFVVVQIPGAGMAVKNNKQFCQRMISFEVSLRNRATKLYVPHQRKNANSRFYQGWVIKNASFVTRIMRDRGKLHYKRVAVGISHIIALFAPLFP